MRIIQLIRRELLSALALSFLLIHATIVLAHAAGANNDVSTFSVDMHGAVNAMGERCMVFEHGGSVSFSYSSEYPLNFNIHHHGESATEFPVILENTASYRGLFYAEPDHEYCFMWENKINRNARWKVVAHTEFTSIESAYR